MFSDRCCVAFVNIYCRACVVAVGCAVLIRVDELGLVGVDAFVLGVCLWMIGFEVGLICWVGFCFINSVVISFVIVRYLLVVLCVVLFVF